MGLGSDGLCSLITDYYAWFLASPTKQGKTLKNKLCSAVGIMPLIIVPVYKPHFSFSYLLNKHSYTVLDITFERKMC